MSDLLLGSLAMSWLTKAAAPSSPLPRKGTRAAEPRAAAYVRTVRRTRLVCPLRSGPP